MLQMDELVRNATIVFVIGCGTVLILIVFCLLMMVASLTFDCWWHLSEFLGYCINVDDDTQLLVESATSQKRYRYSKPWMVRLEKSGKNVESKTYVV